MTRNTSIRHFGPLWLALLCCPLLLASGAALGHDDCESKMRDLVSKAVRDDGYDRAFTIRRDDAREFPVYTPKAQKLVFYEVKEGGVDAAESDRTTLSIVDHPTLWRVFVDPESSRVYRIFGFKSGSEYGALIRALGITLSAQRAEWLAESFIEIAYAERAAVVRNPFEARRFTEDELYTALEPPQLDSYMKAWLRRTGKVLASLRPPETTAGDGDGFIVNLTAARRATEIGSRPKVEIRRLVLHVLNDGALSVSSDQLLASAENAEMN